MLEKTNICELSVISNSILLKIEISIDKRSFFLHWLINFLCHFYERNLKENLRRYIGWTDLSLKLRLHCAGLFTQLPSSFSLRSCARRNLIYFAERSRWIFRVRLPSCVWFSRKYLHLYTTIRTHTRNSSSRRLCSPAKMLARIL